MKPAGPANPKDPASSKRDLRPEVLIALFLAVASFLLYLPSLSNRFVDYDDPEYITANPVVQRGLTAEGIRWAFTTTRFSNWLPVTWLSHMLDVELYGHADPLGHHATSAALHGANAALLYLSVLALASAGVNPTWAERVRALLVAVLFAVHPLRVESVVWIAERKDVLCGTFFLLALLCYGGYCRCAGRNRGAATALFAASLLSTALGLMSKTMLVTLPFLLLLLDFWPLGRLKVGTFGVTGEGVSTGEGVATGAPRPSTGRVLLEKVPFLALTVVASAWTYTLQQTGGAMWGGRELTLGQRAGNAVVSVPRYLFKTVWPADLSVFYPHPGDWPAWQVAASAALIILISLLVVSQVRRRPYLAVGWFWFLGMLVPVSGIVQVGLQSMADRYMYLPGIGLIIAAVWGAAEALRRFRKVRVAAAVVTAVIVCALAVQTVRQQRHWETTLDLFEHVLRVDPDNWLAHDMVGMVYWGRGDDATAIRYFERSTRLNPRHPLAYHHLALSLSRLGRYDEAVAQFRKALEINSQEAITHLRLAETLTDAGRYAEAEPHFQEAVRLVPGSPMGWVLWGDALLSQGRREEAVEKLKEAVRIAPDDPAAQETLRRATELAK
jgi:Flp pilus assembly protein TadD